MISDDIKIALDVDGTLTKEKIRLDDSPKDIEKAMLCCNPKDGIEILFENNYKKYIIITGRIERYRNVTVEWFDMYGIPYKDLIMFPNNFYDKGYSIPKYVEYKLQLHLQKKIHASLDDNIYVVEALNKCGIPCCQVENNFRYAFEKVLRLKENMEKDKEETK